MPVPATTGVLRTKIKDMEIGDYIDFQTSFNSGSKAALKNMGNAASLTEVNVAGQDSAASLKFYMIKTAKGLLVSDRVIQHSISWDRLNNAQYIQGVPYDTGSIIPTMTSNTSPSGVASSSSVYNTSYEAWRAMNGVRYASLGETYWLTSANQPAGWLQYQFSVAKSISGYAVSVLNDPLGVTRAPVDWTLKGSNDGVDWKVIDKQFGTKWVVNERKVFVTAPTPMFTYYRLDVTKNGGTTQVAVDAFELFETAGTIRSLTGGVAYADANGNKSLTDKGFGGWPTNNEYDKFIVNFPTDKMQEGKTVDDVFHWMGAGTWAQDTVINALGGTSGYKAIRTSNRIDYLGTALSSTSNTNWGFRPVFSYKES